MTGILAQTISMISHGNEYIQKGKLEDFYPENLCFQFCNSISFTEIKKRFFFSAKEEKVIALNPLQWFEELRNSGCKKLKLYYQAQEENDHKLAGFVGGGGDWFIECVYLNNSDFWISNWSHDSDLEDNPWSVNYARVINNHAIIDQQFDLQELKRNLKNILERITEFAFTRTTEDWGKTFQNANKKLESVNPEDDFYNKDLIVTENYDLENRQILISASQASVFGGMGSWNDMYFEDAEIEMKYESLSRELFKALNNAILGSINKDKLSNASA